MAKNDYFVLVYKLLSILYEDLKTGAATDIKTLLNDRDTFPIGQRYWIAIFEDLLEKGYIKGVQIVNVANSNDRKILLDKYGIRITADGVEYLNNNSLMRKLAGVIGSVTDFLPIATSILIP